MAGPTTMFVILTPLDALTEILSSYQPCFNYPIVSRPMFVTCHQYLTKGHCPHERCARWASLATHPSTLEFFALQSPPLISDRC